MHVGDEIGGRFVLKSEAGSGGMGTVFQAWDRQDNRLVAIKILRGQEVEDAERFSREIATLAEQSHPAIVKYIGHGLTEKGFPYLVMDWVEGESLAQRLATTGFNIRESVIIAKRLAEALADVHGRGVVHRDIKPSNLLFPKGNLEEVMIIDFGIVRRTHEIHSLTKTGTMIGTPGYMAPEQARGTRIMDARADVFALGCVLYECLTGRSAFEGEHLMALRAKIILAEPAELRDLCPEIPRDLEVLVADMLEKDPLRRPTDAGDVARRLEKLGEPPMTIRRPKRDFTPATQRVRRPRPAEKLTKVTVTVGPEQHLCVILAKVSDLGETAKGTQEVCSPALDPETLREIVTPFGARVEVLAEGDMLVILTEKGQPDAIMERAAHCALAMKKAYPDVPMVLATGTSRQTNTNLLEEVLDRGVRALEVAALDAIFAGVVAGRPASTAIRIDELAASFLGERFEIRRERTGYTLRGERVAQGGAS